MLSKTSQLVIFIALAIASSARAQDPKYMNSAEVTQIVCTGHYADQDLTDTLDLTSYLWTETPTKGSSIYYYILEGKLLGGMDFTYEGSYNDVATQGQLPKPGITYSTQSTIKLSTIKADYVIGSTDAAFTTSRPFEAQLERHLISGKQNDLKTKVKCVFKSSNFKNTAAD